MSRTSTESRRRPDSRFRRALAITVTVLLVLCAVFLALGWLQGPKLSSAQLDAGGLRLFANQAVAQVEPGQVTITPATEFDVTTEGSVIAVQFGGSLDYGTEYSVTVDGVTSAYDSRASTLEYRFTTGSPDLFFLDRGEPDDQIVRTGITGSERETVFATPRIQDFVSLGDSLAVVTLSPDRISSLDLHSIDDDVTERLLLPDAGVIGKLDATTSGSMIGFTLTSAQDGPGQLNTRTLFTVDLDAGRSVEPVLDLDGEPMHVLGWQFAGDTTSIIALNIDRSLLLVDPIAGSIVPLGQLLDFGKVSSDGSVVTGIDALGNVQITVPGGAQSPIEPSPFEGVVPFVGATEVLPSGDRISKAVVHTTGPGKLATLLVFDDGETSRLLYRTVDDRGSIEDFSVSPNGQYVAIETIPDFSASESDGYFHDARSTSTTTVIVEVETGAIVRSFEGFSLAW